LKYALVYKQLHSDEGFSIRPNVVVPSASTIKLFIMAKAFEMIQNRELELDKAFIISEQNAVEETLNRDQSYQLEELINVMIIKSDNVATNTLIDAIGMDSINAFIAEQGFPKTMLQRKMLDFGARAEGKENYTTASDLAKFLEALYCGTIVSPALSCKMLEIMKRQQEKTLMRHHLPPDLVVANKHGDLEGIKHDVGIVYTKKGGYLFAMLTWDGTDDKYQIDSVRKASKEVYEYFMG
jgi:beta-lactamase class A